MSREIDERIVAMHFDNAQFERGARESLKTLDELRKGLDLDGAADSFAKVSKVTSKQLGLKPTTRQVGLFSNSLKSMGRVAKSVFNAATFPIQSITNGLGTLGKYASTVLGFNLADKLVSTGENIIRTFTIDPVKTGWNEYELKMDSIKTIMSGTAKEFQDMFGKDYTEEKHLERIKSALESLNKYADDTIYSFKDMTSNIGKFVNNGVKLDDAVSAMKGISNAAALAGQGTQQASMAMYNLSQAISVGKLTNIDWKSIENANMATLEMKQTFIDTALAMGKLQKIGDKYYIKESDFYKGSVQKQKKLTEAQKKEELKRREVTAENFRNMLQYGFADKKVIEATLGIFSGDLDTTALMKMGFTEKMAQEMIKIGEEAKKAATEVRTFSKMFDALKEAAQSGWAMSFEYIFGDMKEATELWTDMNNVFSDILNKSAETRNNLLLGWRGKRKAKTKDGQDTIVDIEGALDGRKLLINVFKNILITVQSITASIKKAWTSVFGEMTADRLVKATKSLSEFSGKVKRWFGSMDDANSRVSKISKALTGVFSIANMLWNTAKKIFSFVKTVASPVISFLIDVASTVGGIIADISKGDLVTTIKNITAKLKTLTKEKVAVWFTKVGDSIKKLFKNIKTSAVTWLKDNGLGGVVEWIEKTFTSIKQTAEKIKKWSIWKTLGDIWDSVTNIFKPEKDKRGQITGFSPFVRWIKQAWVDIKTTFEEIKGWEIWTTLGDFFGGIWDSITGIFKSEKDERGQITGFSPFVRWIKQAWVDIKTAFEEIKGWEIWTTLGDFFGGIWDSILNIFSPEKNEEGVVIGDSPFLKWINQAFADLSAFFTEVQNWPIWKTLGDFFGGIWDAILGIFSPKEIESKIGANNRPPLGSLIASAAGISDAGGGLGKKEEKKTSQIVENVTSFFNTIFDPITRLIEAAKGWEGWNTIGEVFSTIFGGISSLITAISESTGLDQVLGILERTSQLILNILDKLIEMGNHLIGKDGTWLQIRDWIFVLAIVSMSMYKNKATIARGAASGESIGSTILKLAAGIYLIALAIGTLSAIKDEDFWDGAWKVGVILGALVAVFAAFKTIQSQLGASEGSSNETPLERIAKQFLKYAFIFGTISVVLTNLPKILEAFAKLNVQPGQLIEVFGGLIGLIAAIGVVFIAVSKLNVSPTAGLQGMLVWVEILATVEITLLALVGMVESIGAIIDEINKSDSGTFDRHLSNVSKFFTGIGSFLGSIVGGTVGGYEGAKLDASTDGMVRAAEKAKQIDLDGLAHLEEAVNLIGDIGKAMPYESGFLQQIMGGEINFDRLPMVVQRLLETANKVADFTYSNMDPENIEDARAAFSLIKELMEIVQMADLIESFSTFHPGQTLIDFLNSFYMDSGQLEDGTLFAAKVGTGAIKFIEEIGKQFADLFNGSFVEAAPHIDATPLIQAIYDSLVSADSKKLISSGFQIMSQYLQDSGLASADKNGGLDIMSLFGKIDMPEGGLFGSLVGPDGKVDAKSFLGFDPSTMFSEFKNDKGETDFNSLFGLDTMPEGGLFGSLVGPDGKVDAKSFLGFDPSTMFSEFKNDKGETDFNSLFGLDTMSAFADGSEAMKEYINGLTSGLGEDGQYEVNLVPVWDETNLPGFFGADGTLTVSGTVSIDSNNIASIATSINKTTSAVNNTTSAVHALTSRINGLEAAIRSMKVILDTGVIAGAVDARLGVKIAHGMRE